MKSQPPQLRHPTSPVGSTPARRIGQRPIPRRPEQLAGPLNPAGDTIPPNPHSRRCQRIGGATGDKWVIALASPSIPPLTEELAIYIVLANSPSSLSPHLQASMPQPARFPTSSAAISYFVDQANALPQYDWLIFEPDGRSVVGIPAHQPHAPHHESRN